MKQKFFNLKSWLLMMCLLVGVGNAWAEDPDWSATSFNGCSVVDNSVTVEDVKWTMTESTVSAGSPVMAISSGKLKFGSSKSVFFSSYTLSTDAFSSYNVTKVEVGCYDNGGTESSVTANQGSVEIGSATVSTTTATNVATLDANSGEGGKLSITFASTKQASYITSIKVWYTAGADAVHVTSVSLDKHTLSLMATKRATLVATVAPDNATNQSVSWSSSDEEVATVEKGVVKGLKEGTATITVKTNDGNYTDECEVTVISKVPVGAAFYESFDKFSGAGGNDGTWSGITTVKEVEAEDYDNEGWAIEGSVLQASECASIRKSTAATGGTSLKSGLTTPAIGVAGNGNVTFNAQSWGSDTGDFYVDIVGGGTFTAATGVTLSNNSTTAKVALTKKSEWVDYDLNFTGLTADSKFRFYMASGKRGFLDEVAVFVTPTFASLADLIAANQSFDAVNVTIDDVIYGAMAHPAMPGLYAVMLANSGVTLASADQNLDWLAGGTLTGTLTNVKWKNTDKTLMSRDAFWSSLTYTAPEVQEFASIDELLAANLNDGTTVTVTVNGTITKVEAMEEMGAYMIELDNKFSIGAYSSNRGWKVGGTVSGTLVNVNFGRDEESEEPGVLDFTKDIFEYLTYTAPAVPTFNSLSDLINAGYTERTVVNVTIDNVVNQVIPTGDGYVVYLDYGNVSIYAPAARLDWIAGGRVSGTLENVTWDPTTSNQIIGETEIWSSLTYTDPIFATYASLNELKNAPSSNFVNVTIDDVVEKCEKVRLDPVTYQVKFKNSGVSLLIHTDIDWVEGGSVTGSLENVYWNADNQIIYGKTTDYWEALTYNAPAAVGGILNFVATTGDGKYYATFSSNRAIKFNEAFVSDDESCLASIKAYAVAIIDGEICRTDQYGVNNDGNYTYVPANTGVLFEYSLEDGTFDGAVPYEYADAEGQYLNAVGDNMLVPCTETAIFKSTADNNYYYKLAYGDNTNKTKLGFWWGADDGSGNFKVKAGAAVLCVPQSEAALAKLSGFVFDDDEVNSVNNIIVLDRKAAIYNLNGQRVNANAKGIVIINGKKVVNK